MLPHPHRNGTQRRADERDEERAGGTGRENETDNPERQTRRGGEEPSGTSNCCQLANLPTCYYSFYRPIFTMLFYQLDVVFIMGNHELSEHDNPFTPGNGLFPPDLISRQDILRFFESYIASNHQQLNMRVSGPHYSGKTSLLIELCRIAEEHGLPFIRIDETATADDIRPRIDEYRMGKSNNGIVIAIDEGQSTSIGNVIGICEFIREMRTQGENVSLIVAGKPGHIRELVNNGHIDYIKQARSFVIGLLDDDDMSSSLENRFKVSGIDIDSDCLAYLVKKTTGFPILVQYIGYEAYERAHIHGKQANGRNEILSSDCRDIVINAYRRYKDEIILPIIDGATANELRFLLAMSSGKGTSKTSEIINESGFDKSLYTFVRASLIEEGIIDAPRRGYIAFSVPFLAAWLKAHRDDITARIDDEEAINKWSTASTTGIDDNDELNDALI